MTLSNHPRKKKRALASLATMAVLSSTIGFSLAAAAPANAAPGPGFENRHFSAGASAIGIQSNVSSEGSSGQLIADYIQSGVDYYESNAQDNRPEARQIAQTTAVGVGTYAYGPLFQDHTDGVGVSQNQANVTKTSEAIEEPALTADEGSTFLDTDFPEDGNLKLDQDPISAKSTSGAIDVKPLDFAGASQVDVLTKPTSTSVETNVSYFPTENADKFGLSVEAKGSTGTYKFLNDSVTVEILRAPSLDLDLDGTGIAEASVVGGRVKLTGPDGEVTIVEANESNKNFTYTDPENDELSVSILVNNVYEPNLYETNGSANLTLLQVSHNRTVRDEGGTVVSNTDFGSSYIGGFVVNGTVPTGGIEASEIPDTDEDGLNDFNESQVRSDPNDTDTDGDGLTDGEEFNGVGENKYTSDPLLADTDGDELNDLQESVLGTNPRLSDTDGDGLSDLVESQGSTNPNDSDTDEDGLNDNEFADYGTDPNDADSDEDKLLDGQEVNGIGGYTSDPLKADTDGGGVNDFDEASAGTNPRFADDDALLQDTDSDGLTGAEENAAGTSPTNPDTDGDTLTDGQEVNTYKTNPLAKDTDGDTVEDNVEVAAGLNPLLKDTDSDGLADNEELTLGTDGLQSDSDKDGLSDGDEVNKYKTNPLNKDTDGGTVNDGDELDKGTNPLDPADDVEVPPVVDPDTDKDGLTDSQEVKLGTNPMVADTDRDGLKDGQEVKGVKIPKARWYGPFLKTITVKTNPLAADTDKDGLKDGVEVKGYKNVKFKKTFKSDPTKRDGDRDGVSDKAEVTGALNKKFRKEPSNPLKSNSDGDWRNDGTEIKNGHNPARKGQ